MGKVLIYILIAVLLLAAATWWNAGRREAAAEAAYPPTGQFVTVDGARVHYTTKGTGKDVVLIHGASGNLRDFTFSLVDQLSTRYRVTAFDRPGLGYTDRLDTDGTPITAQANLLANAAAILGLEKPIVVGQSYGGAVSLAWAVERHNDLSALVLLAAPSNPWNTGLGLFYDITSSSWGGALVVPLITAWVPQSTVDNAIEGIFAPQSEPEGYGRHIGAPLALRRDTLRANARQRANLLDEITALLPRYEDITVPTQILHGDADTTVGLTIHSVPLSSQIKDAELTVLPGVGHMPQHVSEPEVIRAIDRAAERAGLR